MMLSTWRYSHFVLAAMSALFVLLLSVTGTILATEPLLQKHKIENLDDISLTEVISSLEDRHEEVLSIKVTDHNQVIAQITDKDFNTIDVYVDPGTGSVLGRVEEQAKIYSWTTALHRSLFLKTTGRVIVAVSTLLLALILTSGIFLLAQRQGGFKMWFSPVREGSFTERWHVILSRWFMLPIYIITLSGIVLSADTLGLWTIDEQELDWGASVPETTNRSVFLATSLSDIQEVTFPFSEDAEDFFHLKLVDKEILVDQINGQIADEVIYPTSNSLLSLSKAWHTGSNHPLWAIVLGLSSLICVFFSITGFAIYLKRKRKAKKVFIPDAPELSEVMIFYGSEKGNVFQQAQSLAQAIQLAGKTIGLLPLDDFQSHENHKHIIVMTSTYGDGDAPSNAQRFESLFKQVNHGNASFSVVAFGSSIYPKFCAFGKKVDAMFEGVRNYNRQLAVALIDEENEPKKSLANWIEQWSLASNIHLVKVEHHVKELLDLNEYKVISKSTLNVDDTFLLRLRTSPDQNFQSGDLLQVKPPNSNTRREYSIARIGNDILLSIKRHEQGLCSGFLSQLTEGDIINASLQTNPDFHCSESASHVIMIANGTGVAPFLGMITENETQVPVDLFLGLRFRESETIYQPYLQTAKELQQLKNYHVTFSQEGDNLYVQDLLSAQQDYLANSIEKGAILMICGSLKMKKGVYELLDQIADSYLIPSAKSLEDSGQLLADCY